jgi:site-specific recombinase XerD
MKYESTKKTTIREAEYLLACRKKDIEEGRTPNTNKIKNCKFVELAQEYSSTWASQQKGYQSKKTFIKQLVEEFGNMKLNEINTLIIEKWQTRLLKSRKPSTSNRTLACLKHMFTRAVDWNMASDDMLKQVRKVKFVKEKNRRLRFLDVDESNAF